MIVDYPRQELGPQQRVGGFYKTVDELRVAASTLEFDVVIPPRCEQGYYMVPAAQVNFVKEMQIILQRYPDDRGGSEPIRHQRLLITAARFNEWKVQCQDEEVWHTTIWKDVGEPSYITPEELTELCASFVMTGEFPK